MSKRFSNIWSDIAERRRGQNPKHKQTVSVKTPIVGIIWGIWTFDRPSRAKLLIYQQKMDKISHIKFQTAGEWATQWAAVCIKYVKTSNNNF